MQHLTENRNITVPQHLEKYVDIALRELGIEHEKVGGKPMDGSKYWPEKFIESGQASNSSTFVMYKVRTNETLAFCAGIMVERLMSQTHQPLPVEEHVVSPSEL